MTACPSSVAFEVADEGIRRTTNVTKIEGLASHSEEEQTIEFLEQDGGGLMDGAEDSLAIVGELPKKGADRPRGLTVKSYIRVRKTSCELRLRLDII